MNTKRYSVIPVNGKISGTVVVPGSKSMTNRALLMAALSTEKSELSGVLFSDDSRNFLGCLKELGYEMEIREEKREVSIQGCGRHIPRSEASIYVGSAGTAARFITAMLALSEGSYEIRCSEQMAKRPMAELFRVLTDLGAEFEYLGEEGHLPVKVKGNGGICKPISLDISKSTQYLSAMLMVAPVTDSGIQIQISSEKKDGAYIRITRRMLEGFGVTVEFNGESYLVPGKQNPVLGNYMIEPDVSAACYFYAMAALTGGSVIVRGVTEESMQGDMKFLDVLVEMGCTKKNTPEGICITGPEKGRKGVDVNMNDFSDQALTLAAIAPFSDSDTYIRNVGHIRGQECDRMAAIVNELGRCGIECEILGDDIHIVPGTPRAAVIETYEDHRVAMAFTLMGLMVKGIQIDNPMCCRKTFENYYETLEEFVNYDSDNN